MHSIDIYISWLIMTIDDVINAKKLDFITKVYRQGEYTQFLRTTYPDRETWNNLADSTFQFPFQNALFAAAFHQALPDRVSFCEFLVVIFPSSFFLNFFFRLLVLKKYDQWSVSKEGVIAPIVGNISDREENVWSQEGLVYISGVEILFGLWKFTFRDI